jgi:signal transduction histidine kinase
MVQELGGEIRVESEVGKGTSFTITLPIQTEKKEKPSNEGSLGR